MATGAQTAELLELLTRSAAAIQRVLDGSAAEYGVSPAQGRMLRALSAGAPTINELARQLALDKSSTSGLVDRAEARGLVRRVRSQLDGRSVRVRLTGPGRELAADIAVLVAEAIEPMLEPLDSPQRTALAAALAQLASG